MIGLLISNIRPTKLTLLIYYIKLSKKLQLRKNMEYYRRFLPHYYLPGHPVFITTRLFGSLPKKKILELTQGYEIELNKIMQFKNARLKHEYRLEIERKYFTKYEKLLNIYSNKVNWLADDRIAKIVADSLHWGDKKNYRLISYTIMPNHIHVVLNPIISISQKGEKKKPEYVLSRIMESFKKYTAREANKILVRKGRFWHRESYDRVIRNEQELRNVVRYIVLNPVKAGLVEKAEDFPWTYVNYDLLK